MGASLSGLFAALALKDYGHITVLERMARSDLKDQGAGLRIGEEVAQFLEHFGIRPEVYAVYFDVTQVVDDKGEEVRKLQVKAKTSSWGRVHAVLMEKVGNLVRDGCSVVGVKDEGTRMKVACEEGGKVVGFEADLVIGADGASSKLCKLVCPEVERTYVGYFVARGLVEESALEEDSKERWKQMACYGWGKEHMILCYAVPDAVGEKRLLNWVWYVNQSQGGLADWMTDVDGKERQITVPKGKMRREKIEELKEMAETRVSPQFLELIRKTSDPILQAVTDSRAPTNCFFDGKVILIGDAVAGLRPHVAAGASQAVLHVAMLRQYLDGTWKLQQFEERAVGISNILFESAVSLGHVCQSKELSPQQKPNGYMPIISKCFGRIASDWDDIKP